MSREEQIDAIRERMHKLTNDQQSSVLWFLFGALQADMTEEVLTRLQFAVEHAEESK